MTLAGVWNGILMYMAYHEGAIGSARLRDLPPDVRRPSRTEAGFSVTGLAPTSASTPTSTLAGNPAGDMVGTSGRAGALNLGGSPLSASLAAAGAGAGAETGPSTVQEAEKQLIIQALRETGGNRTEAARRIGLSRRTLHRKLHEYQLEGF